MIAATCEAKALQRLGGSLVIEFHYDSLSCSVAQDVASSAKYISLKPFNIDLLMSNRVVLHAISSIVIGTTFFPSGVMWFMVSSPEEKDAMPDLAPTASRRTSTRSAAPLR